MDCFRDNLQGDIQRSEALHVLDSKAYGHSNEQVKKKLRRAPKRRQNRSCGKCKRDKKPTRRYRHTQKRSLMGIRDPNMRKVRMVRELWPAEYTM